jgi:outer membrane protein assembly factor BamB
MRNPHSYLVVVALVSTFILALLATACTGVASPKGWSAPIQGEAVLFAAHREDLFALDSSDFAPRWAFPSEGEADEDVDLEGIYATPAIVDSTVFVAGYDGNLYALDLETGEQRWPAPFETDGPIVGDIVADGDSLYFGSADGNVYAVDAEAGRARWSYPTDDEIWSAPAISGGVVYATSLDSNLYALDAANGTLLWSFETAAGIAATPVVDENEGLVLVGGFDSRLRAVDLETHEQRWQVAADNWFWGTPLLADGVVYAVDVDGVVRAVDAATGNGIWSRPFETGEAVRAAPALSGDTVVVVDEKGNVYAIQKEDGSSAVTAGPLALEADVFADPLVVDTEDRAQHVIIVTMTGDVIVVDPETLQVISRHVLAG